MGLVNSKKILLKALEGNYAVGAFNISNMEVVQGIAHAAVKLNSPVIFQVSSGAKKYAGIKFLINLVQLAVSEYNLEASLHLDHGTSFEVCKECIDSGFTSVMIDASSLDFESNVNLTKKVVDYAKNFNVSVEAELGQLLGHEDHGFYDGDPFYTDPRQAIEFVKLTGVDSLAVAVGTSHGAYKFKDNREASLRFDIIEKISKNLPKFPLVLHGASSVDKNIVLEMKKYNIDLDGASGVPEEMLKKASKMNVCKINIDTDVRMASSLAIKKFLFENPSVFDPRNFMLAMRDEIEMVVSHKIINVLGSKDKANIKNI